MQNNDESAFDPPGESNEVQLRNIDMAHECCRADAGTNGVEWVHSYFINKPLSETSGLYEKLAKIVGTTQKEEAQ